MSFSPPLADILAADTSHLSMVEIGKAIIEVVRPDIFENFMRLVAYQEMIKSGTSEKIPLNKLIMGPIRHATLPANLLIRIQIIHNIINEVFPYPLSERINDFRRDMHPDKEVAVWERIVNAYLNLTTDRILDLGQKKEIFEASLLMPYRMLWKEERLKEGIVSG